MEPFIKTGRHRGFRTTQMRLQKPFFPLLIATITSIVLMIITLIVSTTCLGGKTAFIGYLLGGSLGVIGVDLFQRTLKEVHTVHVYDLARR